MESDSSASYDHTSQRARRNKAIARKLSKKSSSQDRHGKIYPDLFQDHTIRAITPETPPTTSSSAAGPESSHTRSAASPVNRPPASSRLPGPGREHAASPSTTDDDSTVEELRSNSRATNRRPEQAGVSPQSIVSKTRRRIGSITTNGTHPPKASVESVGSIGFPSIIQSPTSPNQADSRLRLTKAPPRTTSPPITDNARNFSGVQSALVDPDTSKISSLMKLTTGRMAGILFFRTSTSAAWASGYCAINVASGSLIYQPNVRAPAQAKTLISDLRGCSVRTLYDPEAQGTYLKVLTSSSELGLQLRPAVPETFDSWLAALLCWQPVAPKKHDGEVSNLEEEMQMQFQGGRARRPSESTVVGNLAVIKVGKALLWKGSRSSDRQRLSTRRRVSSYKPFRPSAPGWQAISCTLHENGLLRLTAESDVRTTFDVNLSDLSRHAVQRLDPSVLDEDFCIAVHTQMAATTDHTGPRRQSSPMYLAFDSRVEYEVWFVLVRAFTAPELHAIPQSPPVGNRNSRASIQQSHRIEPPVDMFRLETAMSVRLVDARFKAPSNVDVDSSTPQKQHSLTSNIPLDTIYAELAFDDEPKGRTAVKRDLRSAIWGENFYVGGLPAAPTIVAILFKAQDPAEREWTMKTTGLYDLSHGENNLTTTEAEIEVSSHDSIYGRATVDIASLVDNQEHEQRWPITDCRNNVIGDVLLRLRPEHTVVLMTTDYVPLSQLIHNFSNGLTVQIAQVLHTELVALSEIFVDIFQVSGSVSEWLMNLVEDEIDGVYRDIPPRRFRYSTRMQSNDSNENLENREILLRDLGRSATVETNLLFRGNSLLTKALDAHMRRLGKDYLDETIGEGLRDIAESNPQCEVDPSKLDPNANLDRNWKNLITLTSSIWSAISGSASRCPPELRQLFRHIQSCAQDRYGDFIRSVRYSSVSGFLFLRFFCPAILNPKLFGLLRDHPRMKAHRTFTLMAKSLQGLANMTTFGSKEPWMEPMNKFLSASKMEFRTFIDDVCAVPSKAPSKTVSPSYATPIQILGRLPVSSREGFPSLPFLIDSAQRFADLASLWIHHSAEVIIQDDEDDKALLEFHELCQDISRKTNACLIANDLTRRSESGQTQQDDRVTLSRLVVDSHHKRDTLADTADVASLTSSASAGPGPPPRNVPEVISSSAIRKSSSTKRRSNASTSSSAREQQNHTLKRSSQRYADDPLRRESYIKDK